MLFNINITRRRPMHDFSCRGCCFYTINYPDLSKHISRSIYQKSPHRLPPRLVGPGSKTLSGLRRRLPSELDQWCYPALLDPVERWKRYPPRGRTRRYQGASTVPARARTRAPSGREESMPAERGYWSRCFQHRDRWPTTYKGVQRDIRL